MILRCPYCGHLLGGNPHAVCPACGKTMIVPGHLRPGPERQAGKQAKEAIRREADRVRKQMTTLPDGLVRQRLSLMGTILVGMLLLGWMIVGQAKAPARPPVFKAMKELNVLRIALEMFKRDCGRYPTPEEGIKALVVNPGTSGWKGPYVTHVQSDPWHHPYVYASVSNRVGLLSLGPDGKRGSPDDIESDTPSPEEIPQREP
jgi:type II secretion system protein G